MFGAIVVTDSGVEYIAIDPATEVGTHLGVFRFELHKQDLEICKTFYHGS